MEGMAKFCRLIQYVVEEVKHSASAEMLRFDAEIDAMHNN
jgi:hypothetical protein